MIFDPQAFGKQACSLGRTLEAWKFWFGINDPMIGRRRGVREILVLKANELLHANSMVVNGFRYLGILTVLWGELGGYLWVLWTCRWPETGLVRPPCFIESARAQTMPLL